MKTVAVITEFNPFHNGHAYFLSGVRKASGADYLIAVMSGDFVQRGEPALVNKYLRTEMALHGGADLVLELPVRFATGDAGLFATGAVRLLHSLHVVDELWFGSECGRIEPLLFVADILSKEPEAYRNALLSLLKGGLPYPKAKEEAFCSLYGNEYADLLRSPNNTLGIEYAISALRLKSKMKLQTLLRTSGCNDPSLSVQRASALAIRNAINTRKKEGCFNPSKDIPEEVRLQLPFYSFDLLQKQAGFLCADDFSVLLRYRLLEETNLSDYDGVSEDLAKRIKKLENSFTSFTDFANLVKTKNMTYSHIARAFLHILLKIKKHEIKAPSFAHVLGKKDCGSLFSEIKKKSSVQLCASASEIPTALYEEDLFASNLYESIYTLLYDQPFRHEYEHKLICL